MKQTVSFMLCALLCLCLFCAMPVSADSAYPAEAQQLIRRTTEYTEDGYTIVTEVYETLSKARASGTKSGQKSTTVKNASTGELLFTFTVSGTFRYTGSSATCLDASYSYAISDSAWSLKTASASASGNTATANGTFVRKVALITVESKDVSVSLSCDENGNLY